MEMKLHIPFTAYNHNYCQVETHTDLKKTHFTVLNKFLDSMQTQKKKEKNFFIYHSRNISFSQV